jgi:transposase
MNETDLPKAFEKQQENYAQLQTQYQELQTRYQELQQEHARLQERVKLLEGRAAKDSHNSSKPPSSNGFKDPVRKTQSLRGKSDKPSGGQVGHKGKTLMMVEQPDEIVRLSPSSCDHCHQDLTSASPCRTEQVQVFDLPMIRLHVTEYQAEVKACPNCHHETRAALPEKIKPISTQYGPNVKALAVYLSTIQFLPLARICQLLNDLLGTSFSEASVLSACQESARVISPILSTIKAALQSSAVIHNDETGFRVDKKRWWLHLACTSLLTLYLAHPKRGQDAPDAMGILPNYQGVSVHDTLALYQHYPCQHALCNVHYLRELTYIHEHYRQDWAKEAKALLQEIKAAVDQARTQAAMSLPPPVQEAFRVRYRQLVEQGWTANPPPQERTGKRGAIKQGEVRNLLSRLDQYQDQILRFMADFRVPFENNQAEADLRMMKLRQKISGCFRTQEALRLFVPFAAIFLPCRSKAFIC